MEPAGPLVSAKPQLLPDMQGESESLDTDDGEDTRASSPDIPLPPSASLKGPSRPIPDGPARPDHPDGGPVPQVKMAIAAC